MSRLVGRWAARAAPWLDGLATRWQGGFIGTYRVAGAPPSLHHETTPSVPKVRPHRAYDVNTRIGQRDWAVASVPAPTISSIAPAHTHPADTRVPKCFCTTPREGNNRNQDSPKPMQAARIELARALTSASGPYAS